MDSVLDLFDFSGKGDTQISLPTPVDGAIVSATAKVEEAAASGSVPLLSKALADLRALPGSETYREQPGSALYEAARHGHVDALEYLLASGVVVTPDAVTTAVEAKDKSMLDLLLRSGWDIDESLDLTTPSALGYVIGLYMNRIC